MVEDALKTASALGAALLKPKLRLIAKTDAFSAIVSGAATKKDFINFKFRLCDAGVPGADQATDEDLREAAKYIASSIININK